MEPTVSRSVIIAATLITTRSSEDPTALLVVNLNVRITSTEGAVNLAVLVFPPVKVRIGPVPITCSQRYVIVSSGRKKKID